MYHRKHIHAKITFLLVILVCIVTSCYGLHISGEWRTKDNFFNFLAKFGFQKTSPGERVLTEGYIFGNVTGDNGSGAGTLALLPRQFFLDLYKYRRRAALDPNLACRLMFQEVQKEAYDARCHDSGPEDFLRRVPCPKNQLCPDEDNPTHVVSGTQLTYAVQDINSPRFWYLSFVACVWNSSTCTWQRSNHNASLQYQLTLVNGDPGAADHNPFEYQFSFDKQDTVEIYLVCVVFYGCILVPLQVYAACRQTEVDVVQDIDEYQTWPGWLTLGLRVLIMVWFLGELRHTMTYEHNTNKLNFFLHFGAATLVWFIYLPVVALIALQVSPLWRYKLLLGFTYSADLLAHSVMTYLLWPDRSEQYLLLAYEADLSSELEEFNEAPHVLNHPKDTTLLTPLCDTESNHSTLLKINT
ncbi:uncharacterized protein LOC123518106 isoform X2 [Portunus trituberculatus]|uniref:uncharacterized protein LOC123518106 isoform X2 n=1 Tax=Portunus trituberculatus TaxID=210409 RepID=UPI001E1CD4D6|nr:uncharacterized protein LOC123518106 isoform X2 [Portunus trituberculatus]